MTRSLTGLLDWFNTPVIAKRFHLLLMFAWILLIPPTLIWWKDSILWVLIISLYANIIGHFSAYQAVRAEEAIIEK